MIANDATRAQIHASDPHASTWVSANAGSGKTRVLTDRVARLLFSGTDPQKILCLTYTKAAASEMQNRLFARLGEWAMMPNKELTATLEELGEDISNLNQDALNAARTLFASALETPGGLKIQTIHSFCDALLRRFPLEAGVSPRFEVIEDRLAEQIKQDILEHIAETQQPIFDQMARFLTAADPDSLVREIISHRESFALPPKPEDFEVTSDTSLNDVYANLYLEGMWPHLTKLAGLLEASGSMDQKAAVILKAAALRTKVEDQVRLLETVFLFGGTAKVPHGAKIDSFPTKGIRTAHPDLIDKINPLMLRIEIARKKRLAIQSWLKSKALYDFAVTYLEEYERRKSVRGLLDYDDLIQKTKMLLQGTSLAQWVLYRLDGGIDHILVDEAQDTSPNQWDIVSRLAEEFTSGDGASDAQRTIFVVGDEKQSIYSFQGADPAEFTKMQSQFRDRLESAQTLLNESELLFSFRSAEPILQLVDKVFDKPFRKALEDEETQRLEHAVNFPDSGRTVHHAFFKEQAGRVDLWPFVEVTKEVSETPWYQPVDTPNPHDPRQILAKEVALQIHDLLGRRQKMHRQKGASEIRPKDILILVQRRSTLFHALIKEMKTLGLPVAGADRMEIGAELAVQDVLSLMRFMATPEDNLSLAEALRSPLFSISEEDLFNIAYGRKGSLWEHLRGLKETYPATLDFLWDMLARADFHRPYELIERILTHHKGRENLLARLGSEAEDGVDELLAQSLRYEQVEAPTLTGFLAWFDAGHVEIKRQMDNSSDEIRVMTVHGAKGLEAPIVILPDTAHSARVDQRQTLETDTGSVLWKSSSTEATEIQITAQAARDAFERQERLRLLYVAMTRAENWLIVCGAGKQHKEGTDWYSMIQSGLKALHAQTLEHSWGEGLTLQSPDWDAGCATSEIDADVDLVALPDWLTERVTPPKRASDVLSPSALGGAKALFDGVEIDEAIAMNRGTQIHTLLEYLPNMPAKNWKDVAAILVSECPADVIQEAQNVLNADSLSSFFAPQTMAEVPIVAAYDQQRIEGIIDRLIVSPTKVIAVDFKSNAVVPNTPEQTPSGLLAQMGAYLFALQQVYPDHEIEVGIIWTQTATYMPLSHNIVMPAFHTATTS